MSQRFPTINKSRIPKWGTKAKYSWKAGINKPIFTFFALLFVVLVLLDLNEFFTRYTGIGGLLSSFILLVCSILLIYRFPFKNLLNQHFKYFMLVYLVLLAYGGILTWIFKGTNQLLSEWRYYIPSIIIFITAYRIGNIYARYHRANQLIYSLLLLISINGILIIISILFDINFHESEIGSIERAVGLYSNPNRAGFVSCIGQATAIFLIADNNDFNKKIIAICYLITLAAALATFSKAATLVSIILLMRVFFVKRFTSKWKGRYLNYLRFTLFAIVVFLILNFNSIYSSLSQKQASRYTQLYSFLQGNVSNETTTQRAEIAMFAWDKIKDQWVFGYGVGTFEKMDIGFGTHNQYLLLWGNAGIFGLFVYLAFFVIWYIKASKLSHKNYKTYSINMLLIILASSFTSHTILVNKQYIVALGLLFSAYNYYVFQRKRIPNNIVI